MFFTIYWCMGGLACWVFDFLFIFYFFWETKAKGRKPIKGKSRKDRRPNGFQFFLLILGVYLFYFLNLESFCFCVCVCIIYLHAGLIWRGFEVFACLVVFLRLLLACLFWLTGISAAERKKGIFKWFGWMVFC